MAWLGFGISLTVLILVWCVNALVFASIGGSGHENRLITSLYMLLFLVGTVLGIIGFIFSIVGLVSANKNCLKKWPGVCGIIFCIAGILSVFAPVAVAGAIRDKTLTIEQAEAQEVEAQDPEAKTNEKVVIALDYVNVYCYDNRNGKDKAPAKMHTYRSELNRSLRTWLQMKRINKSEPIVIVNSDDANYSDMVNVLESLNSLGYNNVRIK